MEKCFVYLPVYNGEKFVSETIKSVLEQDYPNYQVVICDDASTDSSEEIIQSYIEKYPEKIIYKKNPFNLGVGTTLHKCCEAHHDGRYFAQVGHDDIWPHDYLSKQINALKNSDAIVSFAKNDYIDSNGKVRDDTSIFMPELINSLSQKEIFLQLLKSNFLCAPASVVDLAKLNAEEVAAFWGYNNDRLQDCELWLNLILHGKFCYNTDVKMHYRVHGNNLSDATKRVIQGKLEYYTMVSRVLGSAHFFEFVESDDHPEKLIDSILDTLAMNIAYSNPVKLLMISLCETFLNLGYNTEKIWSYLNWLYMDSGLITKCQKNNKRLSGKIGLVFGGSIRAKNTVMSLENSGNFEINQDMNGLDPHCICVTQEDNLEYLFNWPKFYYSFMHGQVVLFSCREKVAENKEAYPNFLVLPDDVSAVQLERELYQFVEDKTHIFRNGFFDTITGYGYPDFGYKKIRVDLDGIGSVRAVNFMDRIQEELSFYNNGKEIKQIRSEQFKVFLEENSIQDGCLIIESKNGIGLKDRIAINNTLFICSDVIMEENEEIIPVFGPLSYFNNSHSEMMLGRSELLATTSSDVEQIRERCTAAETELARITQSFSYTTVMKIKKVLTKLHLRGFVKGIMTGFGKLFGGKKKQKAN